MNSKLVLAAAAVALACSYAVQADAATYVSNRSIGPANVRVELTTDGALGYLGSGNFKEWAITVSGPGAKETMGRWNSSIYANRVFATATQLTFDFNQTAPNLGLIVYPDNQGATPEQSFWGFETRGLFRGSGPSHEFVVFNPASASASASDAFVASQAVQNEFSIERTGTLTIGTVAGAAVPEPASWTMMLGGFSLLGAAARRRSRAQVTYA